MAVGESPNRTQHPRGEAPSTANSGGRPSTNGRYGPDALVAALQDLAAGNFSVRLPDAADPTLQRITDAFNGVASRNDRLAREIQRMRQAMLEAGQLDEALAVNGDQGDWGRTVSALNGMVRDLSQPAVEVARVLTAVAEGDLTTTMPTELNGRPLRGEFKRIADALNAMIRRLSAFASEVTRVAREVGTEGELGGQAHVPGVSGTWLDLTDAVNSMATNLTDQVRSVAEVTTAVARGDLSQKIDVEARGEVRELTKTINGMVERLSAFASEVTRVAREVGTEGKLGGQAHVPGAAGVWKDLTVSVNSMATNLTTQVRNIAEVTTAVAEGDLSRKITIAAEGEILDLKNTINAMVDSLRIFADEVTRVAREVGTEGRLGGQAEVPGVSGTWQALTQNVNQLAQNLTVQVRAIAGVANAVAEGDLTRRIEVEARGELAELKADLNRMIEALRETTEKNAEQDWLKSNLAAFSRMIQGEGDVQTVAERVISELAPLVEASHGAFYVMEGDGADAEEERELQLVASYAFTERRHARNTFAPGEGLVGQAALERKAILLTSVPEDYVRIVSGLGEAPPRNVLVVPVLFEGRTAAVIELASLHPFTRIHRVFLEQLGDMVGVVLNVLRAGARTERLLGQSQTLTMELQEQSEELQTQQEELRQTNEELEEQARELKASEELLREQQDELQQVNEELEEKAGLLAEQNDKVEQKNREVERARQELEDKANQLALSSRYKSEFLANMSHELRTPLNSLLILARQLADNAQGNLTEKQVEFARTILSSGTDLLELINDVLDLSKVEAGKMEVRLEDVPVAEILETLERTFRPLAEARGLAFKVVTLEGAPEEVRTDQQRILQVLRNLLSNAVKFTPEGEVRLVVSAAPDEADPTVAFSVQDTGIGIAADKQRLVFEAFQQEDGTTSRRFGGTGLGLSISREITRLLGGELRLESTRGEGSRFTLLLPVDGSTAEAAAPALDVSDVPTHPPRARPAARPHRTLAEIPNPLDDDRAKVEEGDRVVLIVENDERFARILLDMAREKDFRAVVALDGESALDFVRELNPDGITLDMDLPGMDGWAVLEVLKRDATTRHIPVHIVSGVDDARQGLRAGALSYLEKPVTQEALSGAFERIAEFIDAQVKNLLIVEDDEAQRRSIMELVGDDDVEITAVGSAAEALEKLAERHFDCMVLDLGLGDMDGFELLERVKSTDAFRDLPIIVYTGRDLSRQEETRLRRYAETIIVKDVRSPERLLDETALFLHRVEAKLPPEKRRMLEQLHNAEDVFADRKVLIVDDDVRNVFALTSLLEGRGMNVVFAENGREAVEMVEKDGELDMVLMDIMMPEMDGHEAMQRIREMPARRELPIIALTAKAMKGDRERSVAAGASDYIAKPVDTDQLLSLMRVWLYR